MAGLSTELKLATTIASNGNILALDETIYPMTGQIYRAEIGLILAWTSNNDPTILDGYSLINPPQIAGWEVDVINNSNYTIWMIAVPEYNKANTYLEGEIVWCIDRFWCALENIASIIQPNDLNTEWYDMTNDSGLAVSASKLQAYITSGLIETSDVGYITANNIIEQNQLIINKVTCYSYNIQDNTGNILVKTITVISYDGSVSLSYTINPSISTELNLDLSEYGDNVYIVSASEALSDEPFYQAVIYEYCGLRECYLNMFQNMSCNEIDLCTSLASNNCSNEITAFQRYNISLAKLTGFYIDIISRIEMERIRHINMFTLDDEATEQITEIGRLIANAKLVTQSCGECSDTTQLDNPCNCN